ncbi:very short patch repair endonuclease [Aquabacter sp. CN5-332]|uniref:very short patch repair endonuclease n=1 Tax=Aquabacter sp. CN5-332 TaxID=3156608 RepID=UPI0032B4C496
MDRISQERRSQNMSRIRGRNTKPELLVRKAAHGLGYRFRLHHKSLPGSPDLVFPKRKIALFVHGCFWHRHDNCKYCYQPKSNVEFWVRKFQTNVTRDERVRKELEALGWRTAVIWQCQTGEPDSLAGTLKGILG